MKCKVVRHRITIPQEIRNSANIKDGEFLDISYNANDNSIVINLNNKGFNALNENLEKENKPKTDIVKNKKRKQDRKIVANFMDADKLYKKYYSECGLVVRTKTRYVKDFCEDCKGQLAKEWEDKADVKCKYLEEEYLSRNVEMNEIKDIEKNSDPCSCEPCISNEHLTKLKKQRKEEIKNISKSIKEANIAIDNNIAKITNKSDEYICIGNSSTTIKPVKADKNQFLKCNSCEQFVKSGFLLDDDFVCKDCTLKDFKEFMKRMRGNKNV